eukprot:6481048-Pyramimonas_sp.AAC.1
MANGTVCLKEALRNRLKDVECELSMVKCLDLAERKLKEMPEGPGCLRASMKADNKLEEIPQLIFPPDLRILRLTVLNPACPAFLHTYPNTRGRVMLYYLAIGMAEAEATVFAKKLVPQPLAGNNLTQCPQDITSYKHLKEVSLGCNRYGSVVGEMADPCALKNLLRSQAENITLPPVQHPYLLESSFRVLLQTNASPELPPRYGHARRAECFRLLNQPRLSNSRVSSSNTRLTEVEWLFKCRNLLYASVPCNSITKLPSIVYIKNPAPP